MFAIVISLGVFFSSNSSFGQEKYGIGLLYGITPDYQGSDAFMALPVPYFTASWKKGQYVRLVGTHVRVNVNGNRKWQFGPVLKYQFARDNNVDNRAVSKMEEVDASVNAGLFAGINHKKWDASVQYVKDITGTHEGSELMFMAGYSFLKGKFMTRFAVFTNYADDNFMNTYFSVNSENVGKSELPNFTAEAGLEDIGINLSVRYMMSKKWHLMYMLDYRSLLGDASDSPIVDKEGSRNQINTGLAVIYNF